MIPLLILVIATVVLRISGLAGYQRFSRVSECMKWALAVTFVYTGITHFTSVRYDYMNIIPVGVLRSTWVIYITGLLQIMGALGLLFERTRRVAGILLIVFLVYVLPANLYAAMNHIPVHENPPMNWYTRVLIQFILIFSLIYVVKSEKWQPEDA